MKDHWENDEKMMRENTREPVVSFLILPGVNGHKLKFAVIANRYGKIRAARFDRLFFVVQNWFFYCEKS